MSEKFEPYNIVKVKDTERGSWVILSKAIEVKSNGAFTFSENMYVIQSLDKGHPTGALIQEFPGDKLELVKK